MFASWIGPQDSVHWHSFRIYCCESGPGTLGIDILLEYIDILYFYFILNFYFNIFWDHPQDRPSHKVLSLFCVYKFCEHIQTYLSKHKPVSVCTIQVIILLLCLVCTCIHTWILLRARRVISCHWRWLVRCIQQTGLLGVRVVVVAVSVEIDRRGGGRTTVWREVVGQLNRGWNDRQITQEL